MPASAQNTPRILIIESDLELAAMLQQFTVRGWARGSVRSIASTLEDTMLSDAELQSFHVILAGCDFGRDGSTDHPTLRRLRTLTTDPKMPPIVILAKNGSEFIAVQTIQAGAADYLPTIAFGREQVIAAIRKALPARKPFHVRTYNESQPRVFGYELRRCLAVNEHSTVHTAFSAEIRREVVIKILNRGRGSLSRDRHFDRFVDEFRILHDIDDPAVPEIYDFRATSRYCYIAMEYFAQGHLRRRLVAPLAPAEAMRIATEIADALSIIHMSGIVHRDLKPANIMMRSNGSVALIDFGISSSRALTATDADAITGTPYYMSPEQAAGEATDERADLYALGVIIYQMLTGEKPFGGSGAEEILRRHREQPIPRLPPGLAGFQPMLDRLLAKNVDDRLASARELSELIARQLAAEPRRLYALSASSG